MTEPFVVPETYINTESGGERVVRLKYLPALCKAEVEKLRDYLVAFAEHNGAAVGIRLRADTWLGLRFPEAAPELCALCRMPPDRHLPNCALVTPQPSAEPKRHISTREDGSIRITASDWPPVTPSAGERCAWCGTTSGNHGVLCAATRRGVEDAQHRDTVPTPTEGERCAMHRGPPSNPERCVLHHDHIDLDIPCRFVPTPSAGEEVRCDWEYDVPRVGRECRCIRERGHRGPHAFQECADKGCDSCARFTPPAATALCKVPCGSPRCKDGCIKSVGVSAGETKCEHQWATETSSLGKTYCVKCGFVQRDPLVGARPEAECGLRLSPIGPRCKKPKGHSGKCFAAPCTACGCSVCKAREEFVNLIADALGRNDNRSLTHRLETYGGTLIEDAARKVVGE